VTYVVAAAATAGSVVANVIDAMLCPDADLLIDSAMSGIDVVERSYNFGRWADGEGRSQREECGDDNGC